MRLSILLVFCSLFLTTRVEADGANYPALFDEDELSVMGLLSKLGWHDFKDERWNFYGQTTYISQWQPAFHAAYTNLNDTPNSLLNKSNNGFTGSVTFYVSGKAWKGGEFYIAPEMISELPLSGLKGLGGSINDFELQKNGTESATWYTSRAYYRQTLSLGGTSSEIESGPLQIAGKADSRRFVFTAGKLSILDIFDKNTYAGDLRQQFFNMGFMANASYDFAADARGYSWGMVGEYYYDNWAFRLGRFAAPTNPNQLSLNFNIFDSYGDQLEVEHRHEIKGQPGAVRILAYRNRENMGRFSDAIAAFEADPAKNATTCTSFNYDSPNASAPDLCWARKMNVKMGIGINMEQSITPDIGVFFRGMYSDGNTEVDSYSSSDRSMSFGVAVKGMRWGREKDTLGIGYAQSWISKVHAEFLNMGGIDGFIGDGKINVAPEQVVDLYYQCHVFKSVWVSADYQHIANPGYNADRGPLDIYGVRLHLEF